MIDKFNLINVLKWIFAEMLNLDCFSIHPRVAGLVQNWLCVWLTKLLINNGVVFCIVHVYDLICVLKSEYRKD